MTNIAIDASASRYMRFRLPKVQDLRWSGMMGGETPATSLLRLHWSPEAAPWGLEHDDDWSERCPGGPTAICKTQRGTSRGFNCQ